MKVLGFCADAFKMIDQDIIKIEVGIKSFGH